MFGNRNGYRLIVRGYSESMCESRTGRIAIKVKYVCGANVGQENAIKLLFFNIYCTLVVKTVFPLEYSNASTFFFMVTVKVCTKVRYIVTQ